MPDRQPGQRGAGNPTAVSEGARTDDRVRGAYWRGDAYADADLGRNLTWGLHERLGRAIVSGDLADDRFPTAGEIALRHGVSRSVAREAVKMLTAKGILAARPKRGTFVLPTERWNRFDPDVLRWMLARPSSLSLLRHFAELRIAIEPQAAALAARRATEAQIETVAAGLDRMASAERGLDDPVEADVAFHVAVLEAAGDPLYVRLRDAVGTALRSSIGFTNRVAGRIASIPDHAVILHAIRTRDALRAEKSMRLLIDEVLQIVADAERDRVVPSTPICVAMRRGALGGAALSTGKRPLVP